MNKKRIMHNAFTEWQVFLVERKKRDEVLLSKKLKDAGKHMIAMHNCKKYAKDGTYFCNLLVILFSATLSYATLLESLEDMDHLSTRETVHMQ